MKKLIIIAAIMLLAVPTFAAVQNVKVSGDITTYGIAQSDFDFNSNSELNTVSNLRSSTASDESFFATITRLRVDADLTDNVSATVRLINEREWGAESGTDGDTNVDLDLAYITLKEMFYSPLTLIIGRQNLRYGDGLIVGDPDTNAFVANNTGLDNAPFLSKRKAFDAIRAILDYDPWTIDLVYAKIDETDEAQYDEDTDLYGINLAYKFAQYNAEAEGYAFFVNSNATRYNDMPGYSVTTGPGGIVSGGPDAYILGLRGSMVPVDGLTLAGEFAYQGGDYDTSSGNSRDLDAYAASASCQYTWANEYEPTIKLAYDYRSGDDGDGKGDYKAWLPLYEDQTKGLIADYLFAGANGGVNSNAGIINVGGSIKPIADLKVALDWYNYTLDEDFGNHDSNFYWDNMPTGTQLKTNEDNLGDEIDLALTYDYSEDVQFGLQGGYFIPGDIFTSANDDDAYEVIGSVSVSF